jgi:hypothetical protein
MQLLSAAPLDDFDLSSRWLHLGALPGRRHTQTGGRGAKVETAAQLNLTLSFTLPSRQQPSQMRRPPTLAIASLYPICHRRAFVSYTFRMPSALTIDSDAMPHPVSYHLHSPMLAPSPPFSAAGVAHSKGCCIAPL